MPELRIRINHLHSQRHTSRALTVRMYPPPKDRLGCLRSKYKYQIVGAPAPPHDPVYDCIRRTITELSKVDLFVAAANIKTYNMTNSPVLWPPSRADPMQSFKLYAFQEYYEEFPMTLSVMVIPDRNFLHAVRIQVATPDGIKDLKTFLKELPLREWLQSKRPILSQQAFWRKNNKVFCVLDLPKEVRLLLWQFVLGGNIYPVTTEHFQPYEPPKVVLGLGNGCSKHPEETYGHWWDREACLRNLLVNYKVFGVSHQVRSEALTAAWRGSSRKHFTHGETLHGVATTPNTLQMISPTWLTRITLQFFYDEYFRFAGVFPVRPSPPAQLLPTIATLTDLELVVFSPYYVSGPKYWSDMGCTYPCVRFLTDWALTFLFPYIKHLPKVRLEGCIKTVIKNKWNHILSREYTERNETYRSHGYDWNAESSSILYHYSSTPPPECSCPKTCNSRKLAALRLDKDFDFNDTPTQSADLEHSDEFDDALVGWGDILEYQYPQCL